MRRVARAIGWIGTLAVVAAGLWLAGATLTDRAITAGLDELRQAGWQVTLQPHSTRGAPSRLETDLTGLSIAGPGRLDTRLDIPRLRLVHDLTPPGQVSVTAPQGRPALRLLHPAGHLSATDLRLDTRVSPLPPFALQELALDLSGVDSGITHAPQGGVALSTLQLSLTRTAPARYAASAAIDAAWLTAAALRDLPAPLRPVAHRRADICRATDRAHGPATAHPHRPGHA